MIGARVAAHTLATLRFALVLQWQSNRLFARIIDDGDIIRRNSQRIEKYLIEMSSQYTQEKVRD